MITYQVRIKIDAAVEQEWLAWMKTVHVPEVIATGLIRSFHILQPQEGEPLVYYFNYQFEGQADYEHYLKDHATALRESTQQKYAGKFEASRQIYTWV